MDTRNLMIQAALLDLDFLVFSSHKSGTQTVTSSLLANGFKAIHCHRLFNHTVNMKAGEFLPFLNEYWRQNQKKLRIVSIFRDPIDRHISSFFQWHAEGVVNNQLVSSASDTIIATWSIQDLQARFLSELDSGKMVGMKESIDDICIELGLDVDRLTFDPSRGFGTLELPCCEITIFRFDILFNHGMLEPLLSKIAGRDIAQENANISAEKWYGKIFAEFKSSLSVPTATINHVYENKRHLIQLLYPGDHALLVARALERYGPRLSDST